VSADPLRETANRILVEAHLAEGNLVEARRSYARYRDLIGRELGVEPGHELTSLVRSDRRQPAHPGSGRVRPAACRCLPPRPPGDHDGQGKRSRWGCGEVGRVGLVALGFPGCGNSVKPFSFAFGRPLPGPQS
jgi:hypothetical protein